MFLILFISGCLCAIATLSFLARYVPDLQSTVLVYGKLDGTAGQPGSRWAVYIGSLMVPKSRFYQFYLVGLLFSIYCWIELGVAMTFKQHDQAPVLGPLLLALQKWNSSQGSQRVDWPVCLMGHFLFTIHLCRRLYETQVIERPSARARMHVIHYIFGFAFYGAMVFGTWLEGVGALSIWQDDDPNSKVFSYQDIPIVSTMIGTALFLYVSKHQYRCHCILASLRTNDKDKDKATRYRIPYGDWFEFLVSPHYTCDVLVYVSLCIIYQGRSIILLSGLFWTFVSLSVISIQSKSWYLATFPKYPKDRWIMVPGLF